MKRNINDLVRENVRRLKPYSSARSEFEGEAEIFLDANESPYGPEYNRYPDPLQKELKQAIGKRLKLSADSLFLGNGSDEAIDLLFRAFCEPREDKVLICSPTYGMYKVSAGINDIEVVDVPLDQDYQPDLPRLQKAMAETSPKLIFFCSPNNPTGNAMDRNRVEAILESAPGLVILDEAYADFAPEKSFLNAVEKWPNLVVLRTFSKAWGLAGLRLGIAAANPEVINVLNKIKPPYNLSSVVQKLALEKVKEGFPTAQVTELISQRESLTAQLKRNPSVLEVLPSDANFLLVRFRNAGEVFDQLRGQGTIIRDRRSYVPDGLRITIGTPEENQILINQLNRLLSPQT